MNIQYLLEIEEALKPHLLEDHYSFIGPVEKNLFEGFVKLMNNSMPRRNIRRSVHTVLSNHKVNKKLLENLALDIALTIYIVKKSILKFLIFAILSNIVKNTR